MRNYKLYVHINKINNKRYYGITCQDVEKRWLNGKGYTRNIHFNRSIEKYGWNNFIHEVLFEELTEEEAKLLEQMYIALYDTTNREKGYNVTLGGESASGYHHTEEFKQRQSERYSGEGNPNYGKHMSEESKRKISEANKGHGNYGNTNWLGKYHSEETKNKMSEKAKKKKVRCIETGEVFDSITLASKFIDRDQGSLSKAIKKGYKCGGYHWELVEVA